MKTITIKHSTMLAVFLVCTLVASCQEVSEENYVVRGRSAHEDGSPIEAARMFSLYLKRSAPGSFMGNPTRTEIVETNATGEATLEFSSLPTPDGAVAMGKKGYYGSTTRAIWKSNGAKSWTAEVSSVLKPVKNPIPMMYRPAIGMRLNEVGVEYAYDFVMGEALPPHGKGEHQDATVILKEIKADNGEIIEYKAEFRFLNPLDGLVEFPSQPRTETKGSAFVSDYLAPEKGYSPTLERTIGADEGTSAQEWEYIHSLERLGYYFRVRTETNADGQIVSALYGKIYGPIEMVAAAQVGRAAIAAPGKVGLSFCEVYLNPTPNDRNVECAPQRNLSEMRDSNGKSFSIPRP